MRNDISVLFQYAGGLVPQACLTLVTPWTGACQAPLSMGFSRQEYWSWLPILLQGIFPTKGLNPSILHLLHCRWIVYHWATREALVLVCICLIMRKFDTLYFEDCFIYFLWIICLYLFPFFLRNISPFSWSTWLLYVYLDYSFVHWACSKCFIPVCPLPFD